MVLHHLLVIDRTTLPGITDGQLKTNSSTIGLRKLVHQISGAQRNRVILMSHIYLVLLENLVREQCIIFVLMSETVTKCNLVLL